MRAVFTDSSDLFMVCLKSKAQVTSLIEYISPECRYSCLEMAIRLNRIEILQTLLSQDKNENESRAMKRSIQIDKFETGEVSDMAFGFKVRKVNMMRGNRQGNDAFVEDPVHKHQTPKEYLMNIENFDHIFKGDTVSGETLKLLKQSLDDGEFEQLIEKKMLPALLKLGCYKGLLSLFEILGKNGDLQNSFLNKAFFELLTCNGIDNLITLSDQELDQAYNNKIAFPAHVAALNPTGEALKYLTSKGKVIEGIFKNASTQHYAAVCPTDANLRFLEERKCSFNKLDEKKLTPLMWAIRGQKPIENARFLLENTDCPGLSHKDEDKSQAAHYLARYGLGLGQNSDEWIQMFLDNKGKFTQQATWKKESPLVIAAQQGEYELLRAIIEKVPKLNLDKGDKFNRTPLLMACRNGHARIAALLMKHHADPDVGDTSGNTPLHSAAAYGWLECVRVLLNAKVDPSPENAWKMTPITIAIQKNHIAIVKELLSTEQINVNAKDDEGRSLLSLLMTNVNADSLELIEHILNQKSAADINAQDAKGCTSLYVLVENFLNRRVKGKSNLFGNKDIEELEIKVMKVLIECGSNVNMKNKEGKSAFTLAFENGAMELLDLFGKQIDLNADPNLLFCFNQVSIMRETTHQLLERFMTADGVRIEDETINYVNDKGYTPLLWYIHQLLQLKNQTLRTIQILVEKQQVLQKKIAKPNDEGITNDVICDLLSDHINQPVAGMYGNPQPQTHDIYQREIIGPFIKFLKFFLSQGANLNAYVLKLRQYRDEDGNFKSSQSTVSQIGKNLGGMSQITGMSGLGVARKPPEKDQYVSEALGLSNALHLLIDNPVRELFDFIVSNLTSNQTQGQEAPPIFNHLNFQKMSPFFKLVKQKNLADREYKYLFDSLLSSGHVDIDSYDQFGMTAFWFLYTNNRIQEAFYLVDKHRANLNHIDNYGVFPLKKELFANNLNMFKQLLEKGANPNMQDEFQRSVLHLACDWALKRDYRQIFELLLNHEADISLLDFKQRTPLHYLFLQRNKRHQTDHYDPLFDPMSHAFQNINGVNVPAVSPIEQLLNQETKEKFDINQQDQYGKSLMHYMAQRGSMRCMEYVVKLYGVDAIQINQEDIHRNTPLAVAIDCKHLHFVEKLISIFKDKVNLQALIFPEVRQAKRPQMNGFGNLFGGAGAAQDDEQSDLEQMEINMLKQDNDQVSLVEEKKKLKNQQGQNLFRYIIKNNMQQYEKLFIDKGNYDRIQMVVDYICEGQISKLFQVIDTHFKDAERAKESILIQRNPKGQSLIHVLAKNVHLMKEGISDLIKFYKELVSQGVPSSSQDVDNQGRNALHFAVRGGNLEFIKFLIEQEKFDINAKDFRGVNSLCQLLKGDRILTAKIDILRYLVEKGADVNCLYEEHLYHKEKYLCTALIHGIRHPSEQRENIRQVIKILIKSGADVTIQDSLSLDALVHAIKRNHANTFNFILDQFQDLKSQDEESKTERHSPLKLKKDNVDSEGKSLLHHLVQPLPFGSFENTELLNRSLQEGFAYNLRDKKNMTAYQYACLQGSGRMKQVFEDILTKEQIEEISRVEEIVIEDKMELIDLINEEKKSDSVDIDFENDAAQYLSEIQMQIDPHKFVPCDPVGKFSDDCVVMFDDGIYDEPENIQQEQQPINEQEDVSAFADQPELPIIQKPKGTQQYFDVYLTRVEIGRFQPGGDFIFYKMQLVLDRSRDLPILLTRWGRIGEQGAMQKTPFTTIKDAVDEFKKVFLQKTGCKWCVQDKFQKSFGKFQLMRSNYVTLDQKNYLVPFGAELQNLPSKLHPEILNMLSEVCNVNTYLQALQKSGVDPKAMPFSNLDRKNLYLALDILQDLQHTLVKLEDMNPRPYAEKEKTQLLKLREKMWYLSSRFYEYIPHEEYRNKMVPPISNMNLLLQKSQMILNLIQIELASKILLGAIYRAQTFNMNPLEYCALASGVKLDYLERGNPEFGLIKEYVMNTYLDQNKKYLSNIIKVQKPKSEKNFQGELENRVLLFHGSRVSNMLGILSQGLRAQPIEVQRNGNLLGKGIYFTDMVSKAIQYTQELQGVAQGGNRYLLLCEVALGTIKTFTKHQPKLEFPEDQSFTSAHGLGRQGPNEESGNVYLPSGARVPLGKVSARPDRQNSDFQYSEYVVPEPTQVQIRYLIQFK